MKRTSTFFFLAFLVLLVNFANGQIATTTRSTFTSSYTPITIGGGATASTALGDDAFQTAIPVGFTFNHAGVDYTTFQVCTNGWISFDATSPTAAQSRAPANLFTTTVPNRTVAGWFGDMSVTGRGVILYQTEGLPGSQVLTVQFENVTPYFSTPTADTLFINFQIKLYEGTNVIEMIYGPKTGTAFSTSGLGAIGIEDATGGNGNYIDAVTGSRYTNNTMMNAGKWPTENYRFTPGGAPTAIAGGTYNVGIGQTYKNISSAFADLNHKGISGAVTLNLTDNNYDTSAANGTNLFPLLLGPVTGSSAVNTITISKSVGNATITSPGSGSGACGNQATTAAISTSTEPVIGIVGGDWITLRNVNLNAISGSTLLDRGLYVINSSALDGAQNNTFRDFNVTLQRTNTSSVGIQQNTITTPTNKTGTNCLNGYYNFNIKNSYTGVYLIGTGTSLIPDSANTVGIISGGTTSIGDAATSNDIGNGTVLTYGLRAAGQRDFNVSNITVQNVTTTGAVTCDGILLDSATGNSNCFNNVITGIKGTSITSTTRICGITAQSGKAIAYTHTLNVYNNVISAVTSGYTGAATATRGLKGMYIQQNGTGTTATINASFNSVRLDGSGSLTISNVCYEIGTTAGPVINTRDNSFSNFTGGQTGVAKHYTWMTGSTTLVGNTGSVSNYNDLYISNTTNGFVGLTNTTDRALLSDWQTAVSQDANSVSANPTYASSTDLRPLGGSPLLGAGTTVAGITTDILGAARNGSTPTIGAYEASVNVGPSISYSTIGNTSNTGNRSLPTVTITDVDGVASGVNAPRVYWKVNAGSYSSAATASGSSPYDFTIGTTGLVPGDVVSYFVVAQDLTGAVSASPSTGFTAVDVNNVTTPPTTPNTYTIVGTPLSGDYTVGTAAFNRASGLNLKLEKFTRKVMKDVEVTGNKAPAAKDGKPVTEFDALSSSPVHTMKLEVEEEYYALTQNGNKYEGSLFLNGTDNSGIYATISAAIADLNLRGVGGPTRFLLTDASYSESATQTIAITSENVTTAANTFTLKPSPSVTPVISVNTTGVAFSVTNSYVTFDGSNTEGGTSRDMTISNIAVGTNAGAVFVTGSNGTMKNMKTLASSFANGYGLVFSATSNGTVQNCDVQRSAIGIQSQSSTNGFTCTGNSVGSADSLFKIQNLGIGILSTTNFTVSQNTISGVVRNSTAACSGITVGFQSGFISCTPGTVTRNSISDVRHMGFNGAAYGAFGIQLAGDIATHDITIANNVLYNIYSQADGSTSGTTYTPHGIYILTGGGYKIYNNSINLTGVLTDPDAAAVRSGGITIEAGTNVNNLDIRNNITVNSQSQTVTGATKKCYGVISIAASTVFTNIDYNDYYSSGVDGILGFTGAADKTSLAAWKTATGKDTSSTTWDPGFTSATNLLPNPAGGACWGVNGNAYPLAAVSNDYSGNARSTTLAGGATDMGAYEFTPVGSPPTLVQTIIGDGTYDYAIGGKFVASIVITGYTADAAAFDISILHYAGILPPGGSTQQYADSYDSIWVSNGAFSAASYEVRLYANTNNLRNIVTPGNIVLAKSNNGGALWTPSPGTANGYTAGTPGYGFATGLTTFSLFALTSTDDPLPVELSSFTAAIDRRNVNLKWSTTSEQNNAGFDVERKLTTAETWTKIGNVAGSGTSNTAHSYNFEDRNLLTGKYNYRLKQIDNNGNFTYHQLSSMVDVGVPTKFDLSQNYPNPFNPSTKINFDLPFDSKVSIKLFDMTGREVATIINTTETAGYHTVQFNASSLSSGTYFYNIIAEGNSGNKFVATKKMVLVK